MAEPIGVRAILLVLMLASCGGPSQAARPDATTLASGSTFLVVDARALDGSALELAVVDGTIVERDALPADAPRLDAAGATLIPSFVDAHVHFSYDPVAAAHAAGGIAVAIDLASPIDAIGTADPLLVLRAGPMITSPGGYPLNAWGHDGYGIECTDAASCAARVDQLLAAGADLIKVPIEDAGGLDDASLAAIAARAHASHRLLVAHALTPIAVMRAADAGVDVLAHTPVVPLDDAVLERMRGRVVISTLGAFGGSAAAVANLAALRAHGVEVVYGTDLGNTRTTGIDAREIALLAAAGLDISQIVAAGTSTPARVFGLARHGSLTPGHAASFLLYRAGLQSSSALSRPDVVYEDGAIVSE